MLHTDAMTRNNYFFTLASIRCYDATDLHLRLHTHTHTHTHTRISFVFWRERVWIYVFFFGSAFIWFMTRSNRCYVTFAKDFNLLMLYRYRMYATASSVL